MPYSKDTVERAKAIIRSRRDKAISDWEAHIKQINRSLPEAAEIDARIRETGMRIYRAVVSGTGESVDEIKKESTALTRELRAVLKKNGYPENYLDVNYTCPVCSDTGYRGTKTCGCLKEALAEVEFESSGLAKLALTQSFDTFDLSFYTGGDRSMMQTNRDMLLSFADNFGERRGESWLLIGATGLGKTHLSTSVAVKVIKAGYSVVYDSVDRIIAAFEERRFGGDYTSGSERKYTECDLLIIDDLGTELCNQFTVSCLYKVINDRLVNGLSTIINTNLSQEELRDRYTDRIASRLFGEYMPLLFYGTDVRRLKIARR